MAISKEKLIAELSNPIEGDSVASFLRDGAGTQLTSTLNSGKQALDVFVTNPLEIDVGLDAADDSVAAWLKDGSGNALSSTSGALHVRIDSQAAAVNVAATNLDIRDLAFATDKVDVSGSNISISGTDIDIRDLAFATDKVDVSGSSVTATVSGSVTVSATDFDIRNLDTNTDSVLAYMRDGVGNNITSTNMSLHVTQRGALAFSSSANSITTTAELLVASPLAARTSVLIQNLGNQAVFLGDSGVTSATGIRIPAGANVELALGPVGIYAITSTGTADVRVLELAY